MAIKPSHGSCKVQQLKLRGESQSRHTVCRDSSNAQLCVREKKPLIALDAKGMTKLRAANAIARFVEEHDIQVLNVAAPNMLASITALTKTMNSWNAPCQNSRLVHTLSSLCHAAVKLRDPLCIRLCNCFQRPFV
jgi:hypothetical protein